MSAAKSDAETRLIRSQLRDNPLNQFSAWLKQAARAVPPGGFEHNAMTLATADAEGMVSARTVLLKHHDQRGFVFFSNYESLKARQIAQNPHGALLFYWPWLHRQVRIEGTITRISPKESDDYFRSRIRKSRLGALASRQSQPLHSRDELTNRVRTLERRFKGKKIPRPDWWGGYLLEPRMMEFWQARAGRLHDRFRYMIGDDCAWSITRLNP